jgi:hypothetical protein
VAELEVDIDAREFRAIDGVRGRGGGHQNFDACFRSTPQGAAATHPSSHTNLRILASSTLPTHTINRGEIAAIDLGLKLGHNSLLTDNAYSLRRIHEYIRCPHFMRQHLHRGVLSFISATVHGPA